MAAVKQGGETFCGEIFLGRWGQITSSAGATQLAAAGENTVGPVSIS